MLQFKSSWSVQEIQAYVDQVRDLRRGTGPRSNVEELLLHLMEEFGELTREVRRNGSPESISHELADCLFYLAAIATELHVDLGAALESKERINRVRFGT